MLSVVNKACTCDLCATSCRRKESEHERTLEGTRRELEKLKIALIEQKKTCDNDLAQKDAEIQELKEQVIAEERDKERMMHAQLRVKAEHDKCPALIASLRKQIKDTEAALEGSLEDEVLEKSKSEAIAMSSELERQRRTRVRLGASVPTTSTGKLGLGATCKDALLPLPLPLLDDNDAEAEVEDKKILAGTFSGIARLRLELAAAKQVVGTLEASLEAKDDLVTDLEEKLAEGQQKQQALVNQVSAEVAKAGQLEKRWQEGQKELYKTTILLSEKMGALESKEGEIAYLRDRLQQQLSEQVEEEEIMAKQLCKTKSREANAEKNLDQTNRELEKLKAELVEKSKALANKDADLASLLAEQAALQQQIDQVKSLRISLPNPFDEELPAEGSIEYNIDVESQGGRIQLGLRDKAIQLLTECLHLQEDFAQERDSLERWLECTRAERLEEWLAFKALVESSEADLEELQALRAKCGSSTNGLWCRDC